MNKISIPYSRQSIDDKDIQSVIDVLKSPYITQGPYVDEFESQLAEYCGSKYAVAVNNGTAALYLSSLALGLNEKNSVVSSPISFVATSNAAIACGCKPIFCDIDPHTFNIDLGGLKQLMEEDNPPQAVFPVHFAGLPVDTKSIKTMNTANLIVEDACHALGGVWEDDLGIQHRVGDCSFSDLTVFSFHPVKQITTGEGGVITTNQKQLYDRLRMLRSHGITKDDDILRKKDGNWYYEMQSLSLNFRITDIQCALGIQQLKKNNKWIEKRTEIVEKYDTAFKNHDDIQFQKRPNMAKPSYHLYIVQVKDRNKLYQYLNDQGIGVQVHYIPIHLQPFYREKFGFKPNDFPIAESYYNQALSLPLYPDLTTDEQDFVIENIIEFYARN